MIRLLGSSPCARVFTSLVLAAGFVLHTDDAHRVSALTVDVWYAPEDEPLKQVIGLYDRASRYIFVTVYGLTSPAAVQALIKAKKRGLDVRVITDRERLTDGKQRAGDVLAPALGNTRAREPAWRPDAFEAGGGGRRSQHQRLDESHHEREPI